jgi:thioredoxin-like negative regulator of GroEL
MLIADMDCGKYKATCQSFNVQEYPTLIIFKDGKRFEKFIGPRTTETITNYVEKFILKRKIKDKKMENVQ